MLNPKKYVSAIALLGKELKDQISPTDILRKSFETIYPITQSTHIEASLINRLDGTSKSILFFQNGEEKISPSDYFCNSPKLKENLYKIASNQEAIVWENEANNSETNTLWIGVPMSAADRVIGALFIEVSKEDNNDDIKLVCDFIDAISDLAANAINYYSLYERFELAVKAEASLTGLKADNENQLITEIYKKIQDINTNDIDVKTLSIVLQNKFSKKLDVVIYKGSFCDTENQDEQNRILIHLGEQRINGIIETQDQKYIYEDSNEFGDVKNKLKLAKWVGVPMRIYERSIGAFILEHPNDQYVYNANDVDLLDLLSDQAANAISRIRIENRSRILAEIESSLLSDRVNTREDIIEIVAKDAHKIIDSFNLIIVLAHKKEPTESSYDYEMVFANRQNQRINIRNKNQVDEILDLIPQNLLDEVMNNMRPKILSTEQEILNYWDSKIQVERRPKSYLVAPMKLRNDCIGLFITYHMRYENIYDLSDARLLDQLSDHAALALDNLELRKLYEKSLEERISNLEKQTSIYAALHSDSIDEMLNRIIQTGIDFTSADYVDLWFYDKESNNKKLKLIAQNTDRLQLGERFPGDGLASKVITKKEVSSYYAKNTTMEHLYQPITSGVSSEMIISLVWNNETIGILNFESLQEDGISDESQTLAKTLATSASIAIKLYRLKEELEENNQKLESSNQTLKVSNNSFQELVKLIYSDIQLDEDGIAEYIYKLMDTDNMYVATYDENTDLITFRLYYIDGFKKAPPSSRKLKDSNGRTEKIINSKLPINSTAEQSEEWYQTYGKDYTGQANNCPWLGVPILVKDNNKMTCWGVIATYRTQDTDKIFTKQEQEILQYLAEWSAIVLKNAATKRKIAQQENLLTRSLLAEDYVHRLNSLAGTIPGWFQLFKKNLDNKDKQTKYLQNIEKDIKNLLDQVNKLRKEEKEIVIPLSDILRGLVEQKRNLYYEEIHAGKLIILDDIQDDLYVLGISSLVGNSLGAILDNALDAVVENTKGIIEVKFSQKDSETAEIAIKDNGVGVKEENMTKIFDPFFTTKETGIGYGLWRSKSIFEQMKGQLNYESISPNGSLLKVILPLKSTKTD